MKAIVSEKGQVTIPKVIREELGIHPGEVLEFETERGRLVGRKTSARDRVAAVYGILRGRLPEGVDAYIREARGPGTTSDHGRRFECPPRGSPNDA